MFARLKELLLPFQAIATELRIIRELYEMELAERPVPIRRATEAPGKNDTEVIYPGDEIGRKPKSALLKLLEKDETEEDED